MYPDSGPDAVRKDGQVVAVRRLLAPPTSPAPIDPYRTPEVQGSLTRLNLDKECLGMPEDFGTGEQPAGTRRDGTHLGIPAGRVWICRYAQRARAFGPELNTQRGGDTPRHRRPHLGGPARACMDGA